MSQQLTTEQLEELLQREGDDLLTERRTLGDAEITVVKSGELSFIEVNGCYTSKLGQYIERVARSCSANIGLAFLSMERNPNSTVATKFDSTVITVLKRIRERCERRGNTFVLCSPPSELLDIFTLHGAKGQFTIVDEHGRVDRGPDDGRRIVKNSTTAEESSPGSEPRIEQQLSVVGRSLKRTVHMEKEFDSAARCVERFLPQSAPDVPGYSIGYLYNSCEKVGGDFFDFMHSDEDTLGMSIGDVTGHGLDAALVMGITKKLISVRAAEQDGKRPKTVLQKVYRDLAGDLRRKTFVTALYGSLDLPTGIFRYARAGHEFPIMFRPGGQQRILESKGMALGMGNERLFDASNEETAVRLDPGVGLLLLSDGISECRNDKDALYTRHRLLFELSTLEQTTDAQAMLDRLLGKLREFQNGRAQEDDMTAILIIRDPE